MSARQLIIEDNHPIFDTQGMYFKEFPSDPRQIRFFTLLVTKGANTILKELNLLEQQVSELIKNAVLHGNKGDLKKKVKVWYEFTDHSAHVIVEDEGPGFEDIEKWNEFLKKRTAAFESGNYEEMMKYVAWKTEKSGPNDGGNSLFAAVEFWNKGMVYNKARNKVGVLRIIKE